MPIPIMYTFVMDSIPGRIKYNIIIVIIIIKQLTFMQSPIIYQRESLL